LPIEQYHISASSPIQLYSAVPDLGSISASLQICTTLIEVDMID